MICKEFDSLSPKEKTEYIGQVVHSIQSSSVLFSIGKEIIRLAEIYGLFEGVTILPSESEEEET